MVLLLLGKGIWHHGVLTAKDSLGCTAMDYAHLRGAVAVQNVLNAAWGVPKEELAELVVPKSLPQVVVQDGIHYESYHPEVGHHANLLAIV